jgi:plasmid stability protein
MDQTAKVVVSAQVDPAVRERLELLAAEHDRTLSAQVRRVLTAHVRCAQEEAEAP